MGHFFEIIAEMLNLAAWWPGRDKRSAHDESQLNRQMRLFGRFGISALLIIVLGAVAWNLLSK